MKKLWVVFMLISVSSLYSQSRIITGKLDHGGSPLAHVTITVYGSDLEVKSGSDGAYAISASRGDILNYRYPGMEPVDIVVEDVTSRLNISMRGKVNMLREVTVTRSKQKTQQQLQNEYAANPSLIKTAFGIIDAETAQGQVRFLQGDEINDANLCILDVLRAKFAGVRVVGDCIYGGSVYVRGFGSINNSASAIFDVDGMIFTDAPLWLFPQQIHRIAMFNSLTLATRYGSTGAGGVVVINTKSAIQPMKELGAGSTIYNNVYDHESLTPRGTSLPEYLKQLQKASSQKEAEQLYQKFKKGYQGSYQFSLDAYTYFLNSWSDEGFADSIIEENWSAFEKNPVALKSLAYIDQAYGFFEKANGHYRKIAILRPEYAQSYLDLSRSYREVGKFERAAKLLARFTYLQEKAFFEQDSDVTALMNRERNNLMAVDGEQIVSSRDLKKYAVSRQNFGTRLVFEWADSEAEFELQFVNPMKRYYKWSHTLEEVPSRIRQEKFVGFGMEEYFIDDKIKGDWLVNAVYHGNKRLTPTYLKATIYHNYGAPSQRKETKVFKLQVRDVNQQLFKVNNGLAMVSR